MQHFGDLQPLGRPDFGTGPASPGHYSARRSRWRLAVGSLEVGFDRASEDIQAGLLHPVRTASRPDIGWRLMVLMGMLSTAVLIVGGAGWLWSSRGAVLRSETVSASIIDRGEAIPRDRLAPQQGRPLVIPTHRPNARLSALIEQRAPAPAVAPAARASIGIASGEALQPREAPESGRLTAAPDESIVQSGNYLLIPGVADAVRNALTSGEPQNWVAGSYHGLVVVGDAERRKGKSCRQGTVLLRDGTAQGRTQRFERCL